MHEKPCLVCPHVRYCCMAGLGAPMCSMCWFLGHGFPKLHYNATRACPSQLPILLPAAHAHRMHHTWHPLCLWVLCVSDASHSLCPSGHTICKTNEGDTPHRQLVSKEKRPHSSSRTCYTVYPRVRPTGHCKPKPKAAHIVGSPVWTNVSPNLIDRRCRSGTSRVAMLLTSSS